MHWGSPIEGIEAGDLNKFTIKLFFQAVNAGNMGGPVVMVAADTNADLGRRLFKEAGEHDHIQRLLDLHFGACLAKSPLAELWAL